MNDIILTPILDSIQFLNITDEEYFSKKYAGYISNSKLALICPEQGGSPEIYKEGLGKHSKYSSSLSLGSAVHELVLQPESFEVAEGVERPTAKLGDMADVLYPIYCEREVTKEDIINASNKVNYYKDKMTDTKIKVVLDSCLQYWKDRKLYVQGDKELIFLDLKSREKLAKCVTSVENNRQIQDLLYPSDIISTPIAMNEAALFMDVEAKYNDKSVILKLKAKLDNATIDADLGSVVLNDLKTTGHYINDFNDSFEKYRYFRQMGMYIWLLTLYAKKYHNIDKISHLEANMLLVSTVPDYYSGVYKVSKKQIDRGFKEFVKLLKEVAKLELNAG